jgi:hypothetical protein
MESLFLLAFGEEGFLASLAMAGSETFFNKLLGGRPNPLANWKHAIFYYWVAGDPEVIGASFRGISTYKSACRK